MPKTLKVKSNDVNVLRVPFEQFIVDKSEEESYKQLGELVIHNMSWGYSCFVSGFVLFVSEREIKCAKSPVIKAFSSINTLQQFEDLKLPIKNVTDGSDGTATNKAFEIDLSQ